MSKVDHKIAVSMGKGTLFGVVASFTMIGTRFITVPIIVSHLGLGGYGIWSVIMTSAGYMRFGTAGLKSAFQKYVAEATATGDYERANQLITTGSAGLLVLSIVGLMPVAIFSKELAKIAGVPPVFLSATAASFKVLAIIMMLSNFAAVYEAIVCGCNRVDIVRKFYMATALFEAAAIAICLLLKLGLLAMTVVMAVAEVGLIGACYVAAARLLPEIRVRWRYLSPRVLRELSRFAGSYQLLNVLQILSGSILPFGILKLFGATISGIFAISTRVSNAAASFQEASLLPLLSGGTLVYTSRASEQIQLLMRKVFKWTLVATVPPLAFASIFGATLIVAWTGETDPMIRTGLWWLCAAAAFSAISRAGLILYRAHGGVSMDVVRQFLSMTLMLLGIAFGRSLGYYGVLAALALSEAVGAVFMLYVIKRIVPEFHPSVLIPETARVMLAISIVLTVGVITSVMPMPWHAGDHLAAWLRLGLAGIACAIVVWPAAVFTKCLSLAEQRALLEIFLPARIRRKTVLAGPGSAPE